MNLNSEKSENSTRYQYLDIFHIVSNTGLPHPWHRLKKNLYDISHLYDDPKKKYIYEQYLSALQNDPLSCCIAPLEYPKEGSERLLFTLNHKFLKELHKSEPFWVKLADTNGQLSFDFKKALTYLKNNNYEQYQALGFSKKRPYFYPHTTMLAIFIAWHKEFYGKLFFSQNLYGVWLPRKYPLLVNHTHPELWQEIVHKINEFRGWQYPPSERSYKKQFRQDYPLFPAYWISLAFDGFLGGQKTKVNKQDPKLGVRPFEFSYHLLMTDIHPYYYLTKRKQTTKENFCSPKTSFVYPQGHVLPFALGYKNLIKSDKLCAKELFDLYANRHPEWELIERKEVEMK